MVIWETCLELLVVIYWKENELHATIHLAEVPGMCSSSSGEGPWGALQTSTLVREPCICCREMKLMVHGTARNFPGTQKYKATGNQLLILA